MTKLDTLKQEINTFVEAYKGRFLTDGALNSLLKTFQTKNITIQDWNTLVRYVQQNFSTYEALGQLMLKISEYVVLEPSSIFITIETTPFELLSAIEQDKRLMLNGNIIYPYTKHENVLGLQQTITDKLPIVSDSQPQENYVEKQVWIKTEGDAEIDGNESHSLDYGNITDIIESNYEVQTPNTNNYGLPNDVIENNYES